MLLVVCSLWFRYVECLSTRVSLGVGGYFMTFCVVDLFFFFKQKTAYEMRISDWSSDVCSSDLQQEPLKVGYLGPEGTFSQQAVHKHFGHSAKALPLAS